MSGGVRTYVHVHIQYLPIVQKCSSVSEYSFRKFTMSTTKLTC